MKLELIRNATMRWSYAGHQFATDPFLAAKGSIRSFAGKEPNPIVELPCRPEEVLADVEMVVISHLHSDHFDSLAEELLAKDTPIFCQPGDEATLREKGFHETRAIDQAVEWQGIAIERTAGRHGTGELAQRMGNVSGFVFRAKNEPSIYWAGDTIWYESVEKVIREMQPAIIVTHSSGARFGDSDPIVMDAEQTIAVCEAAPEAIVVAVHLESLDHGTVSRANLRAMAESKYIGPERLLIPADGEAIVF